MDIYNTPHLGVMRRPRRLKFHRELDELDVQRNDLEAEIINYKGEDPLEPWFVYLLWIEQNYPSGSKESGFEEILGICLAGFESIRSYYQDRRIIKLFIKYIDIQPYPPEFYQDLYNRGIGTMVADLYIAWAYYYDLNGNFKNANEIYLKGLDARAQPFEQLDQAHKHFGFIMSKRILCQDEDSQREFINSLRERKNAFTSLRSIRTGTDVKNLQPDKIIIGESTSASVVAHKPSLAIVEDKSLKIKPHLPARRGTPSIRARMRQQIGESTSASVAHAPSLAIVEDKSLEIKPHLPTRRGTPSIRARMRQQIGESTSASVAHEPNLAIVEDKSLEIKPHLPTRRGTLSIRARMRQQIGKSTSASVAHAPSLAIVEDKSLKIQPHLPTRRGTPSIRARMRQQIGERRSASVAQEPSLAIVEDKSLKIKPHLPTRRGTPSIRARMRQQIGESTSASVAHEPNLAIVEDKSLEIKPHLPTRRGTLSIRARMRQQIGKSTSATVAHAPSLAIVEDKSLEIKPHLPTRRVTPSIRARIRRHPRGRI